MQFLDYTCPTPAENLALDEALLDHAEHHDGPEVLRVWESARPFLVLGLSCKVAEDVHVEACLRDGLPVLRRRSGGGTVLQGPGSLSYALVLRVSRDPDLASIGGTNRWVLERVRQALLPLTGGIEMRGISDLAIAGRKISGNAQRRKREWILFHGTLLHAFDVEQVERYQRLPPRRPEYRGERAHRDFLRTLTASPFDIRSALRRAFDAQTDFGHAEALRTTELAERYTDLLTELR